MRLRASRQASIHWRSCEGSVNTPRGTTQAIWQRAMSRMRSLCTTPMLKTWRGSLSCRPGMSRMMASLTSMRLGTMVVPVWPSPRAILRPSSVSLVCGPRDSEASHTISRKSSGLMLVLRRRVSVDLPTPVTPCSRKTLLPRTESMTRSTSSERFRKKSARSRRADDSGAFRYVQAACSGAVAFTKAASVVGSLASDMAGFVQKLFCCVSTGPVAGRKEAETRADAHSCSLLR
mmetsp:Transcript_27274/g.40311  ORF Transcript_27274/g.40311 Transcript_27274/m.40311 type:complete len:233 (-) Transcript_27274:40-738(-)